MMESLKIYFLKCENDLLGVCCAYSIMQAIDLFKRKHEHCGKQEYAQRGITIKEIGTASDSFLYL
jgi:hypothetical protein